MERIDLVICRYYYAFIKELPTKNPENKVWEWHSFETLPDKMMPGTKKIIQERLLHEIRN